MERSRKIIDFEIKDADAGKVVAVFATHNVIDKDGDVTLAGAHQEQDVALLKAHSYADIGIGRGKTKEDGDKSLFAGQFNLGIPAGRDVFEQIKFQGDLLEWSYGFRHRKGGATQGADFDGHPVPGFVFGPADDGGPGLAISEVSPVLKGAGEGTRTVSVKSASDMIEAMVGELGLDPKKVAVFADRFGLPWENPELFTDGEKFSEHGAAVVAAVTRFLERAEAVTALRTEKGRSPLSDTARDTLTGLEVDAGKMRAVIAALLADDTLDPDDDWAAKMRGELLRYEMALTT